MQRRILKKMNGALYSMLFNEKDECESYCASGECSICPRNYDCLDYDEEDEEDEEDAD